MVLLEKDGITVQARNEREEADYKKLGFSVVPVDPPATKKAASELTKKQAEKQLKEAAKEPAKEGEE